jgi:L-threonylcarbamoyladenylate synthase
MEIKKLKQEILSGKIFIYPTDTIYGLGCDATNIEAVNKIKEIKGRDRDKPLSVIAPSIEWINEHLIVDVDLNGYLPGPFTIILKKKEASFLDHVAKGETLGVRIPANKFTKEIQYAGVPFITTSVNLSGEPAVHSIKKVKPEIQSKVDHLIYSKQRMSGKPSTLIINGKPLERK